MNEVLRRFIVVPVIFAVLGIAYLLMCLIVFLTGGKRWPLEKKLAIGCLLVSLNAMSPIKSWASGSTATATCYVAVRPELLLEKEKAGTASTATLVVARNTTDEISATLRYGQSYRFTFQVVYGTKILTEGEVLPLDGKLDSPEEKVKLVIDSRNVPAGIYDLVIYYDYLSGKDWRRMESPVRRLKLKVQDE